MQEAPFLPGCCERTSFSCLLLPQLEKKNQHSDLPYSLLKILTSLCCMEIFILALSSDGEMWITVLQAKASSFYFCTAETAHCMWDFVHCVMVQNEEYGASLLLTTSAISLLTEPCFFPLTSCLVHLSSWLSNIPLSSPCLRITAQSDNSLVSYKGPQRQEVKGKSLGIKCPLLPHL